jgi:hypothetical protein
MVIQLCAGQRTRRRCARGHRPRGYAPAAESPEPDTGGQAVHTMPAGSCTKGDIAASPPPYCTASNSASEDRIDWAPHSVQAAELSPEEIDLLSIVLTADPAEPVVGPQGECSLTESADALQEEAGDPRSDESHDRDSRASAHGSTAPHSVALRHPRLSFWNNAIAWPQGAFTLQPRRPA